MGVINSKKSGLYAFIQPLHTPNGSTIVGGALGPQELILANSKVTFENAGIDTTHTIHPVTFNTPTVPGAVIGTTNGIGKAVSGYSKCLMVNGYPALTNSTKKMLNTGNCPISPMVKSTKAKTYFYVGDGGGSGTRMKGTVDPNAIEKLMKANPPWSEEKKAAFNAQFKRCTDLAPTPAPQNILGKCEYYHWRNTNFIKRHRGCFHFTPPDYYLNYGYKYCERFSTVLYPKLDQAGKIWLTKAHYNLQIALEQLLKENPNIELNNDAFRGAVLKTHRKAYIQAGFAYLSPLDWEKIAGTPDLSTWLEPRAIQELAETGGEAVTMAYGPDILNDLSLQETGLSLTELQNFFRWSYNYAKRNGKI